MREIKFEAWQQKIRVMYNVYGFNDDFAFVKFKDDNDSIYTIPRDKVVLRQYTGLKDKDGKEIYEGDIMYYFDGKDNEFKTCVGFVAWEGTLGSYFIQRDSNGRSGCFTFKGAVVVGNLFQNPELLLEVKTN